MRLIDRIRLENPVLCKKLMQQGGFVAADDLPGIIAVDNTAQLLVRCGNGRFLTAADSIEHFVQIITRDKYDYVRDISLPSNVHIE